MTSFYTTLRANIASAIELTPFAAIPAAIGGYMYGKLANLSAVQVAKAWVIWSVAELYFIKIASTFTNNPNLEKIIQATIIMIFGITGIQELEKRGLIGPKMKIFLIVYRTCQVVITFLEKPIHKPS